MKRTAKLRAFFETLESAWGPQHWWPAESQFEVIVGAILTQNAAWTNVEKALVNLRRHRVLDTAGIRKAALQELEEMVRPAGYFRQKAARLKTFVDWLDRSYQGSLDRMFRRPTAELRQELLSINGIGPETADSILLYAGQHEVFVVDAYTRRIFERHGLAAPTDKYDDIRLQVESALMGPPVLAVSANALSPGSVEPSFGPGEEVSQPAVHPPSRMSEAPKSELARRFNEFHGLIVQVGKHYCQSRVAKCELCPLRVYLQGKRVRLGMQAARKSRQRPGK